jgi:hypothetical protein
MKQMQADQRKSFRWTADGQHNSLTYVQKETTYIDEVGLRKALTAKVYDHYTKRVLDRKAMEAAMGTGAVDPIVVSKFVTTKPMKAYLDYRQREDKSS